MRPDLALYKPDPRQMYVGLGPRCAVSCISKQNYFILGKLLHRDPVVAKLVVRHLVAMLDWKP